MIRDLLKWVAPGMATMIGGTALALFLVAPHVSDSLAGQGADRLHRDGFAWAKIQLDGRDALLSGTVPSNNERDAAIAHLAAIPGIRTIATDITVAPLASPYDLRVEVEDGALNLSGSVPNQNLLQQLKALPGVGRADLAIRSGQPEESLWLSAVDFAVSQARETDAGYFQLSGLTLNASARARSERALGNLQMAMADLPPGIAAGDIALDPVRVAPYTWSASFDGKRIAVSGHVPDETLVDGFHAASPAGLPLATGLSLASGAPDGFASQSKLLIEQLGRLQSGEASIVDGVSRLSGTPPTPQVAQAVTETLSGTGAIVQLQPPPVSDYWMSVTRQDGGVLVFDGYVPDEATRAAFAETPDADVSYLKFGSGAPEVYRRAVDFGLHLLARMSEGRIALRGSELSVSGTAASPTDYRSIIAALENDRPQGVVIGQLDYHAPRASTYVFSLRRQADGYVTLSGMLPDPATEQRLRAAAGPQTTSDITYASGEPQNFAAAADRAVTFLPLLEKGEIRFDGSGWTISGTPKSTIDKAAIETEFAVQGLAQSGWELAIGDPRPAPQPVSPYLWSAEKLADGSYLLAGNIPAETLRKYLGVHFAARVTDTSKVSPGAPDGFAAAVRSAADILIGLNQGKVSFDGTEWQLAGEAADSTARQTLLAKASTDLGIDADIAVPAAPATPEPAAPQTATAPAPQQPAEPAAQPEPVATPEPEPAAPAPEAPAAAPAAPQLTPAAPPPETLAACRTRLAELSAHNAILFQSGAAIIAESAAAELDAFAAALAICPDSPVYVAGHTDSDGDDAKNLALSVARAEAVVAALVQRGVAADRLYAIGYGETQPVADNATQDGKRQNRRIVVTIDDPTKP